MDWSLSGVVKGNVFTGVCLSIVVSLSSKGSLSGGLCPGGLCLGASVQGGICPRGCLSGVSVQGVSVQGVSVQGVCTGGSLSRRVSVQGGLCLEVSVRETPIW